MPFYTECRSTHEPRRKSRTHRYAHPLFLWDFDGGSVNPLAMDPVAAAMMGFNIDKIKKITEGFRIKSLPLASFQMNEIDILGNLQAKSIDNIYRLQEYHNFIPSFGFRGHIEINKNNLPLESQYMELSKGFSQI